MITTSVYHLYDKSKYLPVEALSNHLVVRLHFQNTSTSVVFVLYGAYYHSGGRVEAFFSFQAKKLSQNINMYLK